ncbi:MAG TPA: hypothetical protein VNP96_10155 [Solirubrobacterales bacterium]|nr:hypothetical protein [Solirubrobacterales bacterium]
MKFPAKAMVLTGVLALTAAAPALAAKPEGPPPYGQGQGKGPTYTPADPTPGDPTPGPKAGLPAMAKAYGRYCQGKSKEHVAGEKGTEFSRCVTAMARAANDEKMPPGRACKTESKKHVKGEKGTAFSRCVKAVARLRNDLEEKEAV